MNEEKKSSTENIDDETAPAIEKVKMTTMEQLIYNAMNKRKVHKTPRITFQTFQLNRQQVKECVESFQGFDEDGSGSITEKEWRIAMRSMGFEVSKSEVKAMMKLVDTDGNGTIELDEYLMLMQQRLADKYSLNEAKRAFSAYYKALPPLHRPIPKPQRPGLRLKDVPEVIEIVPKITVAHVKKMAEILDEKFSDYEISEMVLEADKDGDGEISENDFIRLLKRTSLW